MIKSIEKQTIHIVTTTIPNYGRYMVMDGKWFLEGVEDWFPIWDDELEKEFKEKSVDLSVKQTSAEWVMDGALGKLEVLDYDGWDRSNFDFSFYKEEITKNEFMSRVMRSTVRGKDVKTKEGILTLDELKGMEPHSIFSRGELFTELSANIPAFRWVAKRGLIHDWAIYFGSTSDGWDKIRDMGEKIRDKETISRLVACTDEAYDMYRF